MRRTREQIAADFWAKVDRGGPDECWEWLASRNHGGYGEVAHRGKVRKAHRVAYELAFVRPPDDLDVLHTCDVPWCVNLAHLWIGTHSDNMRDCAKKGRTAGQRTPDRFRGIQNPQAKLTDDVVAEIRRRYFSGEASQRFLAKHLGVSLMTVNRAIRGEAWSHVRGGHHADQ